MVIIDKSVMTPTNTEVLRMYVVYDSPLDFPGWFVVRGWSQKAEDGAQAVPDEKIVMRGKFLEEIENYLIGFGLVKIFRDHQDDPHVVAVWL
jgi:hypothetical protein